MRRPFFGHLDILTLLIENGADIDPRAEERVTPLRYAILEHHYSSITLLIQHGASLDAATHSGIGFNKFDRIMAEEKIKAAIAEGQKPVKPAEASEEIDLSKILKELQPNIHEKKVGNGVIVDFYAKIKLLQLQITSIGEQSPLSNPAKVDLKKAILDKIDVSHIINNLSPTIKENVIVDGYKVFFVAKVKLQKFDVQALPTPTNPPFTATDEDDLVFLCRDNDVFSVELMIKKFGAKPIIESRECLDYAAPNGQNEIIILLKENGANLDRKDENGESLLRYVIRDQSHYNRYLEIKTLIQFGASLEKAKESNYKQSEFDAGMRDERTKAAIKEGQSLADHTSVRLIGKDGNENSKAGRLEVYHDGRWGTVCNDAHEGVGDQKDNNMAVVVCRMLGQTGGQTKVTHDFGRASESVPTWMDNVGCQGDEKSLFDCKFNPWGEENCGHHEDVGIVCN